MQITSTAFENGGAIPSTYTCDGDRTLSPPLAFSDIPESASVLALLVDDPDVPKERRPDGTFDHWTLYNIPADTTEIPEGGTAGTAGVNSAGVAAYAGPCPPPEYEPSEHRYFFRLYALDEPLNIPEGATKKEVLSAMEGHIIATAELMGRYDRK